jgi:hypothetical protein
VPALGRRRLLTLATAAGSVALLARARRAIAAGAAKALLLSCIDYRLLESVDGYMRHRGLEKQYDQTILAGASLGVLLDQKPDWARTFWDHVDIAKQLHGITEVIAIDHRDCGAFKVFLGSDSIKDPATETATHTRIMRKFATELKARHPDLSSELFLMALDGTVQPIAG